MRLFDTIFLWSVVGTAGLDVLTLWRKGCDAGDRIYIDFKELPGLSALQYETKESGECTMITTHCYQVDSDAVPGTWYTTLMLTPACGYVGMASFAYVDQPGCDAFRDQAAGATGARDFVERVMAGKPGNAIALQSMAKDSCALASHLTPNGWISPRGRHHPLGMPYSCDATFSGCLLYTSPSPRDS